MTINEIEASSVSQLIDAFNDFKKGGSLIHFLESCKKRELINEQGKFNSAELKYINQFNKKLKALIKKSETII